MKTTILALSILLAPAAAWAVCPAHTPAITASATGTFRLCAPEMDADSVPVTAAFYQSCTVSITSASGASFVTLAPITPGATQLVGFPAARGAGTATAFCTAAADGTIGGNVTSVMTFPPRVPAKPGLSQ